MAEVTQIGCRGEAWQGYIAWGKASKYVRRIFGGLKKGQPIVPLLSFYLSAVLACSPVIPPSQRT